VKPPRSILDPKFRYTPAAQSDIRRLYARVRKQLLDEARRKEAEATNPGNVIKAFVMRAK
jgi:hypothetical protein